MINFLKQLAIQLKFDFKEMQIITEQFLQCD